MNTTRSRTEKLGDALPPGGQGAHATPRRWRAGDIVAAVKLKETHTGDTLADKSRAR